MLSRILGLAVAALALASVGCTTVYKQTYYGVTGAEGSFYELKVVQPRVLATYQAFRTEPFTNDLGEHVPQDVVDQVNERAPQELAEEPLFYPEGKALRITGRIIHYTGKSGLEGSLASVLDGEMCVCRVQLLDDASGEMIGEAVCWGMVKSAVRRGSAELGSGVGKGVAKWIKERLPKEVRKTREAELEEGVHTAETAPAGPG